MSEPGESRIDAYIAAGLYDPDGASRPGRLELLDWLTEQGFTLEEMVRGVACDSLGSLAGDRRMVPGERMSRAAAVAASGIPEADFDAMVTALQFHPISGAPDGEIGFTAEEATSIGRLAGLRLLFTPEEAMSLVRVVGSAIGRISDTAVSLFLADIESPHVLAGESELDLAVKVYDAVGMADGLSDTLDPLLRRQMLQAVERTRRTAIAETERLQYRFAVGFVDLVGFTSLTSGMEPLELAGFVRDFEAHTHDLAVRHGGRVVKMIGDEVMFVAEDAADACRVGHALMEGFAAGGGTVVPRGGIAIGHVLPRGGDYYGTVVNLAARLVDQAVPQELLVTEQVAEVAAGCEFEPAGRRMVKGFDQPVVVKSLLRVASSPVEHGDQDGDDQGETREPDRSQPE